MEDTRATRQCAVHGDYSPKNILVHQGRLVLLDHEVIHIGDPGFDIGFSMAHLLSKARHLPGSRRELAQAAALYWRVYADAAAPDEQRCIRHTLGCLLARVAGRSQLEYLNTEEKRAQRGAAIGLMQSPPRSMARLMEEIVAED